jgi:DNA-binding CsgD family transcriptional regulator
MGPTRLSFEEELHRRILGANSPTQAVCEVVAAVEATFALSGAFLYGFDGSGRIVPQGGRLKHLFARDLSWFDDDPCQDRARQTVHTPLVHATRLVSRRRFFDSAAYREFYGPHGLDYIVCLRLNGRKHSAPGMCGLLLGRSGAHGDFTPPQKKRLLGVLPALTALHCVQERQDETRHVLEVLSASDGDERPLLVASATGEVLWCSLATRALLTSTPRPLRADFESAARYRASRLFESGSKSVEWTVHLGAARAGWLFELSSIPHHGHVPLYVGRLRPVRGPEAQLADYFQLTPAEAAVLACLGQGMSNAELAESLSISDSTAATHVKRVLAKMRVDSRLQAGLIMQRARLLYETGRTWHE